MGTVMSGNSLNFKVCKGKRRLHTYVKSELHKIRETGKS